MIANGLICTLNLRRLKIKKEDIPTNEISSNIKLINRLRYLTIIILRELERSLTVILTL